MKSASDIQKAAVLGSGTMGHGIAQVLAMCGIETRVYDIQEDFIEKGIGRIGANLDKGVAKGKVQQADRDAAMARQMIQEAIDRAAKADSDMQKAS